MRGDQANYYVAASKQPMKVRELYEEDINDLRDLTKARNQVVLFDRTTGFWAGWLAIERFRAQNQNAAAEQISEKKSTNLDHAFEAYIRSLQTAFAPEPGQKLNFFRG